MRISDWSSDVCASDLQSRTAATEPSTAKIMLPIRESPQHTAGTATAGGTVADSTSRARSATGSDRSPMTKARYSRSSSSWWAGSRGVIQERSVEAWSRRSEEHTSELQSLMRTSYAVFCLKKKKRRLVTTAKP